MKQQPLLYGDRRVYSVSAFNEGVASWLGRLPTLWIEGETDLPDGAVVTYHVTHALARAASTEDWPARNLIEAGRATVQGGRYQARVNTLNWPPGEVEAMVQFPLPPQPPDVSARYGEFGEQLTGDNVSRMAGVKAVEVTHTFEHQP